MSLGTPENSAIQKLSIIIIIIIHPAKITTLMPWNIVFYCNYRVTPTVLRWGTKQQQQRRRRRRQQQRQQQQRQQKDL